MKELKELINKLEELEEAASKADEAWEQDPESEELEKAFNEAYSAEWETFNKAKNKIVALIGIDDGTASRMIRGNREELKKILEKL
jgi:DNA replication initiation complex subunit (GINS family)